MSLHHLLGQYLLRRGGTGAPAYQSAVQGLGNLIAYYPLNENAGTTIVCPNNSGLNGTYNGGVALANTPGPGASMGNAPLFDGTTGFGQLPAAALDSVVDKTKGTLSFWLNLNELWSVSNSRIPALIGTNGSNRIIAGYKSAASQVDFLTTVGGSQSDVGAAAFSIAGWHNFTTTWNKTGNQLKGYIDGVQFGSTGTYSGTWSGALATAFCLLGAYSGPANFWKGWLSGCSLYSDVKSGAAITTLATAL